MIVCSLTQIKQVLPKIFLGISMFNESIFVKIKVKSLRKVLYFFKAHLNLKFNYLKDICVVDFLLKNKKNLIFYQVASLLNNIGLSFYFSATKLQALSSVSDIFLGANGMERETGDMFGIFFFNHRDLRRILTDYGFVGHPLQKAFSLVGYKEVGFSEKEGRVVYCPVQLTQEFKFFIFNSIGKRTK